MTEQGSWTSALLEAWKRTLLVLVFITGWIGGIVDNSLTRPPIVREVHFFPDCVGDITDSDPLLAIPAAEWNYLQGGLPEAVELCREINKNMGIGILMDMDDQDSYVDESGITLEKK